VAILNEEGSVTKAEGAVDDHDEDFSAVLRETKLLGLDESAFLACVFDAPKATTEGDLLFTTSIGELPFAKTETEG
jgi:hypothetical protein